MFNPLKFKIMKPVINRKTNFRALENLIRTMSKGYFSDFSEYHPDHTNPDDSNDHTAERDGNDFTHPNGMESANKK